MKIALVGNQNSGKTTLFNLLTGTNQKVGNWPGVTIEKKVGVIKGTTHEIVDLPGVYSLSPYTAEEEVSRLFVVEEKPDIIINIVDATCIERSLYLTTQLLELDSHVIIALNMSDLLTKKGLTIDISLLSSSLGVKVIEISALKESGIGDLINAIEQEDFSKKNILSIYSEDIEQSITSISNTLKNGNRRFISVKLIENDIKYQNLMTSDIFDNNQMLTTKYGYDTEQIIANERYNFITQLRQKCVIQINQGISITDCLDKVFLNKFLAIPIFLIIMFLIYFLAVGVVGSSTVDIVDGIIGNLKEWLRNGLLERDASIWLVSLICDGIISGVGAVLNFVPQLIILFLCISILETSGYMSRIAFFLDKLFRKFGLSGKSLIPFIVGSGCSVPAIMTCRTIEDENEKRITIMCTPFIPCSAKLPIIALFTGFFFDKYSGLVTLSLYVLAVVVILLSAMIMKKFFFKSNNSSFISELPEYKLPSIKYVGRDVFDKTIAFIKRAGTVILLCSVIIWILSSFSWCFWEGIVNIEDSMLASIGNFLGWIFYPIIGEWSWAATVSAIQGLVAKEQVVSSMNIIAGLAENSNTTSILFSQSGIFGFFNSASAYAYCVFCLFSAPCFGAIGALKNELGSTKRMFQAILFQTGLAWILASISFGIGSLLIMIF